MDATGAGGVGAIKWKPVSFTHVEYPEGDLMGLVLAWSSLFPAFVLTGFITHMYFRREMHTITYFLGVVVNEMFNLSLKYTFKEARPVSGHTWGGVKYGWPSSHAQFAWYVLGYLILFVHVRSHSSRTLCDTLWKHCVCLLSVAVGAVVSYSRIYLLYHTQNQVVWGSAIGLTFAVVWFCLTHFVLTPHFPSVVHSKLGEMFMIRDSTLIPNVLWFEYTASRQESRTRQRKLSVTKLQ